MHPSDIKIGQVVYAVFRKYGKHYLYGLVQEKSHNEHGLDGWWISILPTVSPKHDPHIEYLIQNRIGVIIPLKDILNTID